jgi:predicted small secreted protein
MVLNWKSFLVGLSSGLVGGIVGSYLLSKETKKTVSPEKVLEGVKAAFKEHGPISGSWIHMEAEPYENNHLNYLVYKGGITKNNNDLTRQYEFVADASTGTILSLQEL